MTVEQRLDELTQQVQFLVGEARDQRELRESISDLTGDLSPIARQSMDSMTRVLVEAESKGYLDFAKSGMGVVDRVVTSFTEEDIESLGDNVVLILETVKEMTQPEVMQMMQSTFHSVQEAQEPAEPPSMFGLLREMRDPETRRGLARMIALLKSMGSEESSIQGNKKENQN